MNTKRIRKILLSWLLASGMAAALYLLGIWLVQLFLGLAALPTDESVMQQQVYSLKNLIVELHKIHHFENFILYRTCFIVNVQQPTNFLILRNRDEEEILDEEIMGKSISNIIADWIWSPEVQKPLVSFTISPWEYLNNIKAIPNLGNILNNKNLAVVILNNIFSIDLKEFVALSLGACFETKIVFVLVGHEMTDVSTLIRVESLKQFFRWCWSKNILNAILMFQRKGEQDDLELEIYTYTPFPKPIRIIQLTKQQPKDYFPNRSKNLLGYKFKAPIKADKPLVFKSVDSLTGRETVTGISGKIFMEYVENVNATFEELKTDNINSSMYDTMDYIHGLLKSRSIDISLHPITALVPHKFATSYPISNKNSCVVVPVQQDICPRFYIPQFRSFGLWFLLIVLFVIFQIVYMYINRRICGRLKPWLAFSTTFKGMLYMPIGNMGHSKTFSKNSLPCKTKLWLHMPLLLTGLIVSQYASITSYLSRILYSSPIESLEDLAKANLSIMMVDYIYDTYKYLDLIPENFSQNLIITDADTVSHHLNKLDTRYAYTVYIEEWRVLQHLQKHLRKPRFKVVSNLCIPNVYLNWPTQFNSPFYKSLKNFILHSQKGGLDIKWSNMIYWQIYQTDRFHTTMDSHTEPEVKFGFHHLTYVLYIYFGGMIAASVAFLIELRWYCVKSFILSKARHILMFAFNQI